MNLDAIIVGGGLTGLTAAQQLAKKGLSFKVLEASDRIGGRVKTDVVNGFRLDHGFQVLLTGYPEAKRVLDYDKLDLKSFLPGAMLLYPDGSKDMLGDPLRDFGSLFPTLFSKAGTVKDKFNTWRLRTRLSRMTIESIFNQKEITTREALMTEYGFSEHMVDQFFEPFFAGIFLEKELSTSRRMFDFVFKMFSVGDTAVPNLGMEEIPKQLAGSLPDGSIQTNAKVVKIDKQKVILADGSTFSAPNIIVATEATGLVKEMASVKTQHRSTTHLHFVANEPPIEKAIIALNTLPNRLVNNMCCINKVASGYAPGGRHLISLSVVGKTDTPEKELIKNVRKELETWFGNSVYDWEHLHTRKIEYALPNQSTVTNTVKIENYLIRKGLYACGDYQLNGSINAAMKIGREVGAKIST